MSVVLDVEFADIYTTRLLILHLQVETLFLDMMDLVCLNNEAGAN